MHSMASVEPAGAQNPARTGVQPAALVRPGALELVPAAHAIGALLAALQNEPAGHETQLLALPAG